MKNSERVSRLELEAIQRTHRDFQQAVLEAIAEVRPEMKKQIRRKIEEKRAAICQSGAEK